MCIAAAALFPKPLPGESTRYLRYTQPQALHIPICVSGGCVSHGIGVSLDDVVEKTLHFLGLSASPGTRRAGRTVRSGRYAPSKRRGGGETGGGAGRTRTRGG